MESESKESSTFMYEGVEYELPEGFSADEDTGLTEEEMRQLEWEIEHSDTLQNRLSDADLEELTDTLANITVVELERNPALNVAYDAKAGLFNYSFPNGSIISLPVPIGGWSDKITEVKIPDSAVVLSTRRSGSEMDLRNSLVFHEPGSYDIRLFENQTGMKGDTAYETNVCFYLYDPMRARPLSYVEAPMGFSVEKAFWNGSEIEVQNPAYLVFPGDGWFEVQFLARTGTQDIRWTEYFTIDRSDPELMFTVPYKENAIYDKEVGFSPMENNCSIDVYLNNVLVDAPERVLRQNGFYRLEVVDETGNEIQYRFQIKKRMDGIPWDWILLPIILIIVALMVVRSAKQGNHVR